MIDTIDIYKAIAGIIGKKFALPVYSTNTEEGFEPECFFLELINPAVSYITGRYRREEMSFRVTFLTQTEKDLKRALAMKSELQELFNLKIKVTDDFLINIMSQTFTITPNNCLEMLVYTETVQEMAEEDRPMMGKITMNMEVGNELAKH